MPKQCLTTSEAAVVLNVTRFTVLNWIKQGKIKAITTFGGHHRIPKTAIASLLKQEAAGTQPVHQDAEIPKHHINSKSIVTERPAGAISQRAVLAAQKANISRMFKKSAYESGKYLASLKDKVTHILA